MTRLLPLLALALLLYSSGLGGSAVSAAATALGFDEPAATNPPPTLRDDACSIDPWGGCRDQGS